MKLACLFACLALAATPVHAQPTQMEDCVGPGSPVCIDSPRLPVEDRCGPAYYRFNGRIAWPPLKYIGPVTISIQTRRDPFTTMPLYLEIRDYSTVGDTINCRTGLGGNLLLIDYGGATCGGNWISIGPVDLQPYGVTSGEPYLIQIAFFESLPLPTGVRTYSPGLSCIRVVPEPTAVSQQAWSSIKTLYR